MQRTVKLIMRHPNFLGKCPVHIHPHTIKTNKVHITALFILLNYVYLTILLSFILSHINLTIINLKFFASKSTLVIVETACVSMCSYFVWCRC